MSLTPDKSDDLKVDPTVRMCLHNMRTDIAKILRHLEGEGPESERPGVLLDVDRLKRNFRILFGALWVLFAATVGAIVTAISQAIAK